MRMGFEEVEEVEKDKNEDAAYGKDLDCIRGDGETTHTQENPVVLSDSNLRREENSLE